MEIIFGKTLGHTPKSYIRTYVLDETYGHTGSDGRLAMRLTRSEVRTSGVAGGGRRVEDREGKAHGLNQLNDQGDTSTTPRESTREEGDGPFSPLKKCKRLVMV